MRVRRWGVLALAGSALLLAGCTVNVATTVDRSGAGTLQTELGFTPDELQQLQAFGSGGGGSVCDAVKSGAESSAAALSFKEEKRGDETWCVATQTFTDLEGLRSLYDEMGGITVNQLELADGKFAYDLSVDMGESQGMPLPGVFTWTLQAPGKPGASNATEVAGNKLTWELQTGQTNEVKAESAVGGGGLLGALPRWVIPLVLGLCVLGLMVVVAAAGVFLLLRSRKKTAAA